MTREELVRLAVLLNIADDYEEPVHVHMCVAEELGPCELMVDAGEIKLALTDLFESGLAKAYRLGGADPGEELQKLPPFDGSHDYYFLISDEGRVALGVWRVEWPLDDVGDLRPDWSPSCLSENSAS